MNANSGDDWEDVSGTMLDDFTADGVIRRIITHPTDGNIVYFASSEGIYKSGNALSVDPFDPPSWDEIGASDIDQMDKDLKGLEFHPYNSSIMYCSGKDIYVSTDAGDSWSDITTSKGLDISSFNNGNFVLERINISVTAGQ